MIREIHLVLLVTAILILPSRLTVSAEEQPTAAGFEKDIRPILEQNCFPCHTKSQHTSGLVLETLEGKAEQELYSEIQRQQLGNSSGASRAMDPDLYKPLARSWKTSVDTNLSPLPPMS